MRHRGGILVAVVALLAAAGAVSPSAGAAATGGPRRGGGVTFGLEAETPGGFCLPQAQLAPSGIQEVAAIYDTLTTVNAKGQYVPYLAQSVTPNATNDEWTIKLRDGVKFHDGTPLDAAAVKLNLDSYRGANPRLPARLTPFSFNNVADVRVVDPLTLVVTTKTPWAAFPAVLFGGGRYGIAAPAQLNNPDTCATNLIGTGPFRFQEWRVGDRFVAVRNPDYWQKGYPLLDTITFRPVPEASARLNQFDGGVLDVLHTTSIDNVVALRDEAKNGKANVLESDKGADVAYMMLNASKPPFNDIVARQAVAYARNTNEINDIRNRGITRLANGPFAPGTMGYVADTGTPKPNLKKAKQLVSEYEAKHGEKPNYEYVTVNAPDTIAIAELVKAQAAKAGITVTIRTEDQAALINDALAGTFQAAGWRNHGGFEPDAQGVWWRSDSPLNFGRIHDPEVDRLLDAGRAETDAEKRAAIYQDLNRELTTQAWNLWSWYTLWQVAAKANVKGVTGPPLPDGGGKSFTPNGGVVPVLGMWRAGS